MSGDKTCIRVSKVFSRGKEYKYFELKLRWKFDPKKYKNQVAILSKFRTPYEATKYVMNRIAEEPVSSDVAEIKEYLRQMFESGQLVLKQPENQEAIPDNADVKKQVLGFLTQF